MTFFQTGSVHYERKNILCMLNVYAFIYLGEKDGGRETGVEKKRECEISIGSLF